MYKLAITLSLLMGAIFGIFAGVGWLSNSRAQSQLASETMDHVRSEREIENDRFALRSDSVDEETARFKGERFDLRKRALDEARLDADISALGDNSAFADGIRRHALEAAEPVYEIRSAIAGAFIIAGIVLLALGKRSGSVGTGRVELLESNPKQEQAL